MQEDLISIIVPAYNAESFLQRAVQSIMVQTYQNLEVLVINDGSTDNTELIVKILADKDSRVKLISKENGGVSSARNLALDHAKGKYVAFVDADDWVEPSFISQLIYMLEDNQVEFSICGIEAVSNTHTDCITGGKDGKYSRLECAKALLSSNGMAGQPSNKLYLRSIIEANHIRFNKQIANAEDLLFQMEYVNHISNAYYRNEPLYKYAVIEGSASHGFAKDNKIRSARLTELQAYHKISEIYAEKDIHDLLRDKENHFRMEIIKTILVLDLDENELYHEYRSMMLQRMREIIRSDVDSTKGKFINLLALCTPKIYKLLRKK